MVVVHKVRRASNNAAASLGLQRHHQSTSYTSVVPAVMVITTSLVHVFLCGTYAIIHMAVNSDMVQCVAIAFSVGRFVYAYNFYVYLITGKQFRSELRQLLQRSYRCSCSCSSSSYSSVAAAVAANAASADDSRVTRPGYTESAV